MQKLPIQIRFNDIDQMGHVNNSIIMEYFDLGKEAFFNAAGILPEQNDFTVMIVHFDVDFHAQIRYHDIVSVTTECVHFGNKSLQVKQQVVNNETGKPYATCLTIMSGYCRSTGTSAVIPDKFKENIAKL